MTAEDQDRAELARMLAEWLAFKQAFCDGFWGRPFRDYLEEQDHARRT